MFTLFLLGLLALLFLLSLIMLPISIGMGNKIRNAGPVAPATTVVIPWYFNWVIWLISLVSLLLLICLFLGVFALWSAIPTGDVPVIETNYQQPPSSQFGLFVISNGYGINGVFGGNSTPEVVFMADGQYTTPYKTDCRVFEETPFYGYNLSVRCDYLFYGSPTVVEVVNPQGYTLRQHGITLMEGAIALTNSSWQLP